MRNIKSVLLIVLISFLIQLQCIAQDNKGNVKLKQYDFSYKLYSEVLKENVIDGLVDYTSLKNNRVKLDKLVDDLKLADLSVATDKQKLAFYSNSYNILTLKSVVDAYPVNSIKDIDGVWDNKKWMVAGEELTLNDIEHEILRKKFHEPRIHVAVNCASIGCPPLLEVPYYPDQLDSLLTVSAKRFAGSTVHNRIDFDNKNASLSSIFDWFGDDFIEHYYKSDKFSDLNKKKSAALNFILSHHPESQKHNLTNSHFSVKYIIYDWSLNDLKR